MRRMLPFRAVLPALALAVLTQSAFGVDPTRTTTGPFTPTGFSDPFVLPGTPQIAPVTPSSPGFGPASAFPTGPAPLPGQRDRVAVSPGFSGPSGPGIGPVNPLLTQPPGPTRPPRWRLGVYSQDTDTGVKILRVVANSPAERAGLEPHDVIVAVSGHQVGIVNGQPNDCGNEFEQHADNSGRVMLLVMDSRNRTLVNLPLQLESRLARVSGTVAYRDRIVLPPDAVAVIELREASDGRPGNTLGQQRVEAIRQIPIPFEIEYDPLDINPRRTYVVTATITFGGRPIYTTVQQFAVITNGRPQNVAVAVERSQPGSPTAGIDQRSQIEMQIVQWFRQYYGRDPRPEEMPVWTAQITERGRTAFDVQADMLSNAQVWNRCDQNETRYIELLSESLVGKKPSPEELDYWMWRYQQSGGLRRPFAEDFLTAAGVPR